MVEQHFLDYLLDLLIFSSNLPLEMVPVVSVNHAATVMTAEVSLPNSMAISSIPIVPRQLSSASSPGPEASSTVSVCVALMTVAVITSHVVHGSKHLPSKVFRMYA